MDTLQVILLFVSFCIICALVDIVKIIILSKVMKGSVKKIIDAAFAGILSNGMKATRAAFKPEEKKEVSENEVSDLR